MGWGEAVARPCRLSRRRAGDPARSGPGEARTCTLQSGMSATAHCTYHPALSLVPGEGLVVHIQLVVAQYTLLTRGFSFYLGKESQ